MKILYVVNDLSGMHGWSTYTQTLLESARATGHEVRAAVHETSDAYAAYESGRLPYRPLDLLWNPFKIYQTYRSLANVIKEESPDCVHVVAEPYVMPFAFFLSLRPSLFLTIHGTYAYVPTQVGGAKHFISLLLYKMASRHFTHIIAVSKKTKQRYEVLSGESSDISIIPNAYANKVADFTNDKKTKPYIAITIGAVKRRKGIHEAIASLSDWSRRRIVPIEYHIVGMYDEQDSYYQHAMELAEQYSHDFFSVQFHGLVSETEKEILLQRAHVYMHLEPEASPTDHAEGFGLGILEAAGNGVPAIVAKESATREAILEGRTGFAVAVGQNNEILEALDRVLIKRQIKAEDLLGWVKKHSPSEIYKRMQAVYENSYD